MSTPTQDSSLATDLSKEIINDKEQARMAYHAGSEAIKEKRYEEALKHLGKSIFFNPSNLSALVARANIFCKTGELTKALKDAEEAITIGPYAQVNEFCLIWFLA